MSIYFNRKPKRPPTILKEIPKATTHQISDIFSGEVVFNESTSIYSDALRKSGANDNITFIPKTINTKKNKKKTCKCKIFHIALVSKKY